MEMTTQQIEALLVMLADLRGYYFDEYETASEKKKRYINARLADMAVIELGLRIKLDNGHEE